MVSVVASDHPLTGTWVKIERAGKHIIDFHAAQQAFLDSYPVAFTHDDEPDSTGHYNVRIADIKPVPPELSLILGDAIHNLRSALDLLACQLIKLRSNDHNCKNIYFPILDSAKDFIKALKKNEEDFELMGEFAINILTQLQPYRGGKGHKLWMLHRLDIQDKHRLLIVVLPSINGWRRQIEDRTPNSLNLRGKRFVDAEISISFEGLLIPKAGITIDRIPASIFPDGVFRVGYKIEGEMAFNEPEIIKGESAFSTLRNIYDAVIETIRQFEPFFSR